MLSRKMSRLKPKVSKDALSDEQLAVYRAVLNDYGERFARYAEPVEQDIPSGSR